MRPKGDPAYRDPREFRTVSGDPDALERYSKVTLDAVEPATTSGREYGEAVHAYLSSPNDLGAGGVADHAAAVNPALAGLRHLDKKPNAFAYALRRLDKDPGNGYSVGDLALFNALARARLELPHGSERAIWHRALDIRWGTGTQVANKVKRMIDALEGIDKDEYKQILGIFSDYLGSGKEHIDWSVIANMANGRLPLTTLRSLAVSLPELEGVFGAIGARRNDPAFLKELFGTLGPKYATRVPEVLSATAYREIVDPANHADNPGGDLRLGFSPREYARTYSEALANASNLQENGRFLLGDDWWRGFFSRDNYLRDGHVNDAFPALFSAGEFRPEVAEEAGNLGVRVLDHEWDVDKGPGSPLYAGFEDLHTHWEDRGGVMLDAASRVPEAANNVLLAGSRDEHGNPFHGVAPFGVGPSERPNIKAILDPDYDHMDAERVGQYYGRVVDAGTIGAERVAIGRPGVDDNLLRQAWEAKGLVVNTVADHHASDKFPEHDGVHGYPESLNESLTDVAVSLQPHALAASVNGTHGAHVAWGPDGDPTALSASHGLVLPDQTLGDFYSVVMQADEDRLRLVASARAITLDALGDRMAAGAADGLTDRIARNQEALLSGHLDALNADRERTAAEMEAANKMIDGAYGGATTALGLIPGPGTALKVTQGTLSLAGGTGLTPALLDQLHQDVAAFRAKARDEGIEALIDATTDSRDLVVEAGYLELRRDLDSAGGDPDGLAGANRELYEILRQHDVDARTTTLAELQGHDAYDSISSDATDRGPLEGTYDDLRLSAHDVYAHLRLPAGR